MDTQTDYLAFSSGRRLARGSRLDVALAVAAFSETDDALVLCFEAESGRAVDFDLSGGPDAIRERFADDASTSEAPDADAADAPTTAGPRRRGRPRLGVVGREVTLLPRHWSWLETQRGGASATLRRLVDAARREDGEDSRRRAAQDRSQRLMTALAGDLPGYEEATRALYAGDGERFAREIGSWPTDVRACVEEAARDAFGA